MSASAYYERASGRRSERSLTDEWLLQRIKELHAANYYAYGYRRMWKALQRAGEPEARCSVRRPMAEHGIQGAKRRGKPWRTTRPDPQAQRRADLVQRDFSAKGPDELWLVDLSCFRCWEGVVFFAFIIDALSRRIVGWQFALHMRTDLVLDARRMALADPDTGADVELVHHSDRGSQYTSIDYTQRFQTTACSHPSARSATPTATRWPRASSIHFKTELISDRVWRTRSQLELAIVEYVGWFNHDRLHESLGDLPPAEEDLVASREPARHQVEELPQLAVKVIEHRCQRLRCPQCGAERIAPLPGDVAASAFGPHLQAAIATLSVRNRVSRRDLVELLRSCSARGSAPAPSMRSSRGPGRR